MAKQWNFSGVAKKCAKCERDFEAHERVTSVLYMEGVDFVRRDCCDECFAKEPDNERVSVWHMPFPEPEDDAKKRARKLEALLDPVVLIKVFQNMSDTPDPKLRRFRFMLALMLMRKKKLKMLSVDTAKMADGPKTVLKCREVGKGKTKKLYDVVDVKMDAAQMEKAQDEIGEALMMGGVELGCSNEDGAVDAEGAVDTEGENGAVGAVGAVAGDE